MNSKVIPQDLTNADTVDDLTRRCRELRADLEAAAVREAELRGAYQENFGMLLSAFDINDDSEMKPTDTGFRDRNAEAITHNLVLTVKRRMDAALTQPSPLAEAVRCVLDSSKMLHETISSEDFWEMLDAWERTVNTWLSLRDGRDADGGEG